MSSIKLPLLFSLILLPLLIEGGSKNAPLVTTSSGKVQGTLDTSFQSREFFSFRGIPYAEPPLGDFRFKVSFFSTFLRLL
jgi:carboxylesterase 2